MSKIQINLELDSNETATVKALAALLTAMAEEQPATLYPVPTVEETTTEAEIQPAPAKKRTRKATPEPEVAPEEAPTPEPEEAPTPTPEPEAEAEAEAAPEVTLDDLRSLLATKVKTHREEIKAKLTELGGSNLTTLPADKYATMDDFLKGL